MLGVFYVIARVYVMKIEVCQQCFVLLSRVYDKHGTAQSTADTPHTSLHKHGTIKKITPDTPHASLYKHGTIYVMKLEVCHE
jgi:hypothetical protein